MFARRMVAGVLVCALAGAEMPALPAKPAIWGTVMAASDAQVGTARASVGTTVFDGDALWTGDAGQINVQGPNLRLLLSSGSGAKLRVATPGVSTVLDRGTLVFSSSRASAIVIEALQAQIRAAADVPTVAQVSILGPKSLFIKAEKGAVNISYQGEEALIPEGASARVVLDPDEEEAQQPQGSGTHKPPRPPHRRKLIVYITWGALVFIPVPFIVLALESPDRP